MYYKFFGLKRNPFDIHPDPKFLYLSEKHREALSHLSYCVMLQKPFLLLTGDIGVGKTTILNYFIASLRKKKNIIVVPFFNPRLSVKEFYTVLASELKLPTIGKKAVFLLNFRQILQKLAQEGKTLVLIIDEGQAASIELLEELRLLSNLAEGETSLVIILVGQPEIEKKLACEELYALKQRITYKYHLGPFESPEDVSQYLITRILRAGSPKTRLFNEEAIEALYRYSRGIPRLINILADHALLAAFLKEQTVVDAQIIEESAKEIDHILSHKNNEYLATERKATPSSRSRQLILIFLILLPIIIVLCWIFREKIPFLEELFGQAY